MPPDEPPLRDRISQLGAAPRPSPLGRLVMGVQVPPPVPPDAPPRVAARPRALTTPAFPAPPPGGPVVASLPPPAPARAPAPPVTPEPPRSITPGRLMATGLDSEETLRRAREVVARRGERIEDPPQSLPSRGYVVEQPWWRTAKGIAVAVPVIVAGLGGLTPAVVLPVIKALREPYDGARAKDIAEAKKAGEECQAAVASERKSTLAREEALAARISEAEKKTSEVVRSVPVVKPDPNRPPK